jgi:valyl-tRNA synthetase
MLAKSFSPADIEQRLYEGWEQGGAFAAHPESRRAPFTIMIPPPNVTGSLHMGHALTFTLQDTLIRWRRMSGRDALWQPGTDHAGIATQMVVERLLASNSGTTRQAIGREAFLERVWQWKGESGGTITRQLRRLGASLDWPRERFTMDEGLSRAVRETFVTLYDQGLIYRDRRLVNWDPKFQSAISDLEVESKDIDGHLWHLRYPIADQVDKFIVVATSRPETLLGDTAIAVHPGDARFAGLVGQHAILPLTGRRIPIIADEYSDPEKGSGAVKITPAHDFNDFAVGQRHALPMPSVLDREARITLAEIDDPALPDFTRALAGLDRFEARKRIVAELERLDLVEKIAPHRHAVPHGDRSGVPVEPLLTTQWFCNAAALAGPALLAVESGETVFVPKQWENTFFSWLRDIEPWCISRQLWWGHRIPAWYDEQGRVYVARTEAEAVAQAGGAALTQDEDVLDTWFSSGLWPFSTLGWPEQTPELGRYYPGDVLVTGFDIIFFWVARMMMLGLHMMNQVPFRHVVIHGLVRDERGQKMSKSKGNVIDPLELIEKFGTDALRFTICRLTGPGRDIKLGATVVEGGQRFVTKLWNAAKFCEINGVAPAPAYDTSTARLPLSRWIMDALNRTIAEANSALEAFRFNDYADACYRFVWNDVCDWFVELAKPVLAERDSPAAQETRQVGGVVLGQVLRLLHPLMPYVTEELWDHFGYGPFCSLITTPWPEPLAVHEAEAARADLGWVVRLVSEVRTVRSEMNVSPATLAPILLKDASAETRERAGRWFEQIARLARASELKPLDGEVPKGCAQAVLDEATIVLPLAGLIDIAAERTRLERERARALQDGEKIAKKLANDDFVKRAPEAVVDENRERLTAAQAEVSRLEAALQRIA